MHVRGSVGALPITVSTHWVPSQSDRHSSMHAAEKCATHRSESVLKETGHGAVFTPLILKLLVPGS